MNDIANICDDCGAALVDGPCRACHPVVEDAGPLHRNTFDTATGVNTFTELSGEHCAKAPDKKHDWSGPWIDTWTGQSSTCVHCGMTAEAWDMRYGE